MTTMFGVATAATAIGAVIEAGAIDATRPTEIPSATSGFSMRASGTADGRYFAAIASTSSFQRGSSRRQHTTVDAGACPRRRSTRMRTLASSSAGSAR